MPAFSQEPSQPANYNSLGQSDWQTPGLSQPSSQSAWQNPAASQSPANYDSQAGQTSSMGQSVWQTPASNQNNNLGQSGWQTPAAEQNNNIGQSAWQQPQSAFQNNSNQSSNTQGDYYYGQANQGIPVNNLTNQSQSTNSNQNNNTGQSGWQTATSQTPAQQGQVQKNGGGIKQIIGGVTQAALQGARIVAPVAGMYMYGKALSSSPYGMMGMMSPYGMGMSPYTYGVNPYAYGAVPYNPAMSGLSSFMHY